MEKEYVRERERLRDKIKFSKLDVVCVCGDRERERSNFYEDRCGLCMRREREREV